MSTQVRDRVRFDLKSFTAPQMVLTLRPTEMVAAGVALGLVLLVILYYFLSLSPSLDRLAAVEKQFDEQLRTIALQATPPHSGQSQKQQIQQAKDSLGEFENGRLKAMTQGRIDVINEINQLARTDNVHLGSGIEMNAVHRGSATADGEAGSKRKKDTDALDVFPRVQFHFVVRGEYRDLRKYLRDLEGSKQYVVVDAVSLSNAELKQGRGSKVAQVPTASGLSLTVSMNAYFRP